MLLRMLSALDTFDGSESIVNGPFYVDRVKHVLMSVGMNYPSERILLFAPSFRKASRTSRCIRHIVYARYMPRVMFIPWILNSSDTENYLRKSALNWNIFSWSFVWKQDIGRFIVNWAKAQRDSSMLVEHQNFVRCYDECGSEQHGTLACRSLISLSNNCVWECFFECCLPAVRASERMINSTPRCVSGTGSGPI